MSRRRRGVRKVEMKAKEPPVNAFAAQHGDYREATIVDLSGELGGKRMSLTKVLRVCYPNTVDKWLDEGGPGFEEPQRRAISHCRQLWACAGSAGRQVANYGGMATSECGREWDSPSQTEALAQLGYYRDRIPSVYWRVFENMARDDFGAGEAGKLFAGNTPQAIAHAKSSVGFVASLIAQWRGF